MRIHHHPQSNASNPAATTPWRIAVTGSSGLIGGRVVTRLTEAGHTVHPLVRRDPRPDSDEIRWDPDDGLVDAQSLAGIDAVVHLAGENVASGRWTTARKAAIRDSRVVGTTLLTQCLTALNPPPKVFVAASAIGFYGDRGDEIRTEDSTPGQGFLSDVARQWEAATRPAADAGVRVVNLRIGVVLTKEGAALARMLPPFRRGVGGRIGTGRQYMSWISHQDVVRSIAFALTCDNLSGPVNATAPNPVTNNELTKVLGAALGKPTPFPVPAIAIRLALGELGRALLLSSTRVHPARLTIAGFHFHDPHLATFLQSELQP